MLGGALPSHDKIGIPLPAFGTAQEAGQGYARAGPRPKFDTTDITEISPSLDRNRGKWFWGRPMAQEHRSGQIVPESGVYRVTHLSAHAAAQLEVRLIKGRRFPACPYCQEIGFELAHSDEAFWRDRSAPGTRYRRHRRSARGQSSNKAVAARSRAVPRFVGWARWSAILGAIVVAVRGLPTLRG